jgi:excisionase family DNA binding protein
LKEVSPQVEAPTLVDAKEVARHLGVSAQHVYELANENQIPCFRVGRLVRFDIEKVFEALEDHR